MDLNRDAYPLYNARHQITRHTRADNSYVNFGYDDLGQLTSAVGSGGQSTENLGYPTTAMEHDRPDLGQHTCQCAEVCLRLAGRCWS